jgi:photosystem II stability/assembly factor-like uncharacterized protein
MLKRILVIGMTLPAIAAAAWNAHGPSGGTAWTVAGSGDNLLIGTADGVYQSSDAGATWHRFGDLPRGYVVSSLAVSPADPDVILAGGASYRTTDGGGHWTPLTTSFDKAVFNPLFPQSVVAIRSGIYSSDHVLSCSNDGGITFTDVGIEAAAVVADFATNAFTAIDTSNVVYKTSDTTNPCFVGWTNVGRAQTDTTPYGMLQDPLDSNVVFISSYGLDAAYFDRYDLGTNTTTPLVFAGGTAFADVVQPGRLWLSAYQDSDGTYHLWESTDGGSTWPDVVGGLAEYVIGTDPLIADTLYGNDAVGFAVSHDAGRTWESRTQGVPLSKVAAVSIRGDNPDELLAASPGDGISISSDGGLSWSHVATPPPNNVRSFARSPADPTLVYAGTDQGVYRSTDAGGNWQLISTPSYYSYESIVIDRNDSTKMAAIAVSQVFWSDDAGSTWTAATIEGGGSADFREIGRNSYGSGIVYALAWLHNDVFALYRAPSHGQPLVAIAPDLPLNALAISPANDRILFAIAHDDQYLTATTYLSVDGGDHWLARGTFDADPTFIHLRFDPCNAETIYLQAFDVLYISHDLGLTWSTEQADLPVNIVNDIDTRCTAGTLSMAVATYSHGAEVRDLELIDTILGDGFEGD